MKAKIKIVSFSSDSERMYAVDDHGRLWSKSHRGGADWERVELPNAEPDYHEDDPIKKVANE